MLWARRTIVGIGVALLATGCATRDAAENGPPADSAHWYAVYVDGARVGHSASWRTEDGGVVTHRERMAIALQGGPLGRRTEVVVSVAFVESAEDEPLSREEHVVAGNQDERRRAVIERDMIRIDTWRNGRPDRMRRLERPPDLLFPEAQAALLRRLVDTPGARHRFSRIGLGDASVTGHELEMRGAGALVRNDGPAAVTRVAIHSGVGARSRPPTLLFLDEALVPLRIERPFRGRRLTLERTIREGALAAVAPWDHLEDLLVPSPFPVTRAARRERLRYFIRLPEGMAFPDPVGVAQRRAPSRDHAGRWVVDVCAGCGADSPPAPTGFLAATRWLESDAPDVVRFAWRAAGRARNASGRMARLEAAVREHIDGQVDYVGYETALGALRSRRGDCTEYALLLAAAGRALGVPARVVSGVHYGSRFAGRRRVFAPHAWVEAWTGERWESFDAGSEGFDNARLALSVGEGDPEDFARAVRMARVLRLESLAIVAEAPTTR